MIEVMYVMYVMYYYLSCSLHTYLQTYIFIRNSMVTC